MKIGNTLLTHFLKIVTYDRTRFDRTLRQFHPVHIDLLPRGKPFVTIGFRISPDHQKVTIIPSSRLDFIEYWTWVDDKRQNVLCHMPENPVEVDLASICSISFDILDLRYEFQFEPSRISDLIEMFRVNVHESSLFN